VLNFGQPITHSFLEQYMPERIKAANDVDAYRDWKQSEIYLKMGQLQKRRQNMKAGIDQYTQKKIK
jgi:hypothetical protein